MSKPKKGIVLCHGHDSPEVFNAIQSNVEWIFVDRDEKVKPDVVADVFDSNDLINKLSPNGELYDYVIDFRCPIVAQEELVAQNINRLLKPGGKFIIIDGVIRLFIQTLFTEQDMEIEEFEQKYQARDSATIRRLRSLLRRWILIGGYEKWFIPVSENKLSYDIILTKSEAMFY